MNVIESSAALINFPFLSKSRIAFSFWIDWLPWVQYNTVREYNLCQAYPLSLIFWVSIRICCLLLHQGKFSTFKNASNLVLFITKQHSSTKYHRHSVYWEKDSHVAVEFKRVRSFTFRRCYKQILPLKPSASLSWKSWYVHICSPPQDRSSFDHPCLQITIFLLCCRRGLGIQVH